MDLEHLEREGLPSPERKDAVMGRTHTVNFYGCEVAEYKMPSQAQLDSFIKMVEFKIDGESKLHRGKEGPQFYHAGLLESHLHIDWWPDRSNGLQITLHYCNYSRDNADRARMLLELMRGYFKPTKIFEHNAQEVPM